MNNTVSNNIESSTTKSTHVVTLRAALLIIESPAIKGLTRGTVTIDQAMEEIAAIIERETAAPDLLSSLQWIVTFCREHPEWFGGEDGSEGEWLESAEEAIAKAEGRTS